MIALNSAGLSMNIVFFFVFFLSQSTRSEGM